MTVYDFKVKAEGREVSLEKYRGKVLLIINTATKCGLTPQYEALEALYQKYKERGLEILDFPSNQFLAQAPGTDEEITEFCTLNYGTTFARFAKLEVNGEGAAPLYKWLKEEKPQAVSTPASEAFAAKVLKLQPVARDNDVKWNFEKFLIDRSGHIVERFQSAITPEELYEPIEALL